MFRDLLGSNLPEYFKDEPIRKKTMNKLRNLKNEVERMERGMNVRQTIYDGRQLEGRALTTFCVPSIFNLCSARGDINALEARVQDKLEFNKQKRKEINDLLQEPPKKAATPVADLDKEEHKPAPVVAKKRRRIVDSDDDEEPQASEHRATGADDA
jgi:hypothetical protein